LLKPAEQDLVIELLVRYERLTETPRTALAASLVNRLVDRLPAGPPDALPRMALNLCLEGSYTSTPPAMVQQLELIVQLDGEILLIIDRIRVLPPKLLDIFDLLILDTKCFFWHAEIHGRICERC